MFIWANNLTRDAAHLLVVVCDWSEPQTFALPAQCLIATPTRLRVPLLGTDPPCSPSPPLPSGHLLHFPRLFSSHRSSSLPSPRVLILLPPLLPLSFIIPCSLALPLPDPPTIFATHCSFTPAFFSFRSSLLLVPFFLLHLVSPPFPLHRAITTSLTSLVRERRVPRQRHPEPGVEVPSPARLCIPGGVLQSSSGVVVLLPVYVHLPSFPLEHPLPLVAVLIPVVPLLSSSVICVLHLPPSLLPSRLLFLAFTSRLYFATPAFCLHHPCPKPSLTLPAQFITFIDPVAAFSLCWGKNSGPLPPTLNALTVHAGATRNVYISNVED
ncbi:hypothetical protein C8J57DRAFT_1707190 [Mycena rebaudengoi]|nr:hypothetical protein C8J57DRAFT_1707190 [Mycena rebaudengoi]